MENLSAYRNEARKEKVYRINDQTEKCQKLLDEATARFNMELENIESKCLEPQENPDVLLNAVTKAMNNMSHVCEEFERGVGYDKTAIKDAQANFREKTKHIISKSYFNRARIWPQGYQGDYIMLETVYRNTPLSNGIGHYLDKYFLSAALSNAVRGRRATLRDLLKIEFKNKKNPKILDIACGSSREVFELASDIEKSGAKMICMDFDSDALDFSANRMSYANLSQAQIEFRKYNALKMTSHERNLKEFGMQDIIYSTGLFDYLEDDVIIHLFHSLYKLLTPKGTLITSFKDCRRYKSFDTQWLLAWDGFLQRTQEDIWNLFEKAEIPHTKITTIREKSGVINFFTAVK